VTNAPPDPLIGQTFGLWKIVGIDPTRKRISAACNCGTVRVVALDALTSGSLKGCGSCSWSRPARPQPRVTDGAAGLASLEIRISAAGDRGRI
jgi:hypothetical protein